MASRTKQIAYAGMFTAIIAVLSQIAIPMPSGVPTTLQTLVIVFCGLMLGWKTAIISVSLYIAVGAIGLPVFSGYRGGIGALFGVTGGFIFGFVPFVILCGIASNIKNRIAAIAVCILGLLTCHLLGIIQYMLVTNIKFIPAFITVSLPFIIKDIASCVIAYFINIQFQKSIKL